MDGVFSNLPHPWKKNGREGGGGGGEAGGRPLKVAPPMWVYAQDAWSVMVCEDLRHVNWFPPSQRSGVYPGIHRNPVFGQKSLRAACQAGPVG